MANLNAILGLFGVGKTGTASHMALEHMSKGGLVASNINFRAEPFISHKYGVQCGFVHALRDIYGWEYQDGQFIFLDDTEMITIQDSKGKTRYVPLPVRFYEKVPRGKEDLHVMVIIDEAHKVFPKDAYTYMPCGETDIISVLRHLNIDLYIMTQAWEHVWTDMRRLTEEFYKIRNLRKNPINVSGQMPFFIRPIAEIFSGLLKLLLLPFRSLIPNMVILDCFLDVECFKKDRKDGYPKWKKYLCLFSSPMTLLVPFQI